MIITRPGAHRSTTSAGQASPPTTNATDSNPCGDNTPTADGVWLNTLTCSATSNAWNSSGERATASGTTTSRPPPSSAPKISHTEKCRSHTNATATTPAAARRQARTSNASDSWVTLRWVIATPLGTPVVPEV